MVELAGLGDCVLIGVTVDLAWETVARCDVFGALTLAVTPAGFLVVVAVVLEELASLLAIGLAIVDFDACVR